MFGGGAARMFSRAPLWLSTGLVVCSSRQLSDVMSTPGVSKVNVNYNAYLAALSKQSLQHQQQPGQSAPSQVRVC